MIPPLGEKRGFTEYLHILETIISDFREVKRTNDKRISLVSYCESRPKQHKDKTTMLKSAPEEDSVICPKSSGQR